MSSSKIKIVCYHENIIKTPVIIIFLVGVFILGRVVFNAFVGDDSGYIFHPYIQNQQLEKLFIGSSADLGGSSPITGQFYRPLMLTTISFIYLLFGKATFAYHLLQLVLHIANSVLIFFILKKFGSQRKSLLLALIFLIHPINVETFAYVSNFQDVLSMFFGLSALTILSRKRVSPVKFASVVLLLLCSLLSKESGILFVAIVSAYLILIMKTRNSLYYFSIFGLVITYLFIRVGFAGVGFTNSVLSPIGHLTLIERLYMIPDIFNYYLRVILFPLDLAIGQVWITNTMLPVVSYLTLPAALIAIIYFAYQQFKLNDKKFYEFIFFALWFVAGLLIHIQIIPLEMTVADRWFYFPFVGLLGMVAVSFNTKKFNHTQKIFVLSFSIILVSAFAIRSFVRLSDWKDALTLYSHDTKVTNSYLLEHSLGFELMESGKLDLAEIHLKKSIDLYQTPFNTNSMGVYFYKKGDIKSSLLWFEKSMTLGDYFLAYQNYARLLLEIKDYKNTAIVLNKATKKFPKSDIFYRLLALAEYKNGEMQKALKAATSAYNLSPSKENEYIFKQLLNGNELFIRN